MHERVQNEIELGTAQAQTRLRRTDAPEHFEDEARRGCLPSARPKWKGATKVLHLLRKATKVIDDCAMVVAINEANRESHSECGSNMIEIVGYWRFLSQSRELYQLLCSDF